MMRDKKGFLLPVVGVFYLVLILAIIGLLIFGVWKASGFFSDAWGFFKQWWWAFLAVVLILSPVGQAIIKRVFKL